MKLAFDFGITNTDIVSYLDGKMKFFSHPSEEINEKFLTKLLLHAEIDLDQLNVIAVTGGKSSDLGDTFNNLLGSKGKKLFLIFILRFDKKNTRDN